MPRQTTPDLYAFTFENAFLLPSYRHKRRRAIGCDKIRHKQRIVKRFYAVYTFGILAFFKVL